MCPTCGAFLVNLFFNSTIWVPERYIKTCFIYIKTSPQDLSLLQQKSRKFQEREAHTLRITLGTWKIHFIIFIFYLFNMNKIPNSFLHLRTRTPLTGNSRHLRCQRLLQLRQDKTACRERQNFLHSLHNILAIR